jgi:predicted ATPase
MNSRLFVQGFSADCLIIRGEYQRAIHETDAICGIASDFGFPYFVACGLMLKGRAASRLGQGDGVSFLEKGLQLYRSTGAKWALPKWLGWFASAPGQQVDVARATLGEAFDLVHETGERFNEAELYHLRGELSLSVSAADECASEADFLLAKRIAADQGAKLFELRAATSLARLWRDQGKLIEARDLLAPIYGWFTEGFDTLDLKQAKALLDELTA